MLRPSRGFLLAMLVLLSVASVALAADYITSAVEALKSGNVYVDPGTEGTDSYTAGKLQSRLSDGDNIALVMLPASAETALGMDITTIASQISQGLNNQRIIGLSVGNKVVGYAPSLPVGVAADQMRRAQSVSNDPITALGTFAQDIHIWQRDHPAPTPPPEPTPSGGGLNWVVLLAIAITIVALGLLLLGFARKSDPNAEKTSFSAPDQVKDLLGKIAQMRSQINDPDLSETVYQLCLDIEHYFGSSSSDKKKDSIVFKDRLTEVLQVLQKYVDVQNNRRYYEEPSEQLRRGKTSVEDYAEYVVESIRRGHSADLVDYKVNTNILQAQRYR